ncbi:MAG: cobalamin biosynthesis protein CbiX [Verrucomicrobia bacterium]|nr:cobalamin biosynthesis protein CbiX [Verrucomicrobiota bacterium]
MSTGVALVATPHLSQPWSVNPECFSDAALVVLGHGTTLNDNSAAPVLQHAAELRRRKIFADVREAFWKQEPQIKQVLAEILAPRVFIVPMFISEGYFASEVIPRELGFVLADDPASRVTHHAPRTAHYCKPVGTHESMTRVLLARAREIVERHPFPRAPKTKDITLFIAGHGTERSDQSRKNIERQVELIRAADIYADVRAVFMEEDPHIKGCQATATTRHVVVVPFFISDGLHVVEDIPVLLGEPERLIKERHATGQPTWRNPTEKHGKLTWYSPAVGSEPLMADVILERAIEAAETKQNL